MRRLGLIYTHYHKSTKDLLYSTRNHTQYSIITFKGKVIYITELLCFTPVT